MAGTTFNWTATASSAWTVGTNRVPDGPPTAADRPIVPAGSSQINPGTVAIDDLSPGRKLSGPPAGEGTVAGGELPVPDALAVLGGSTSRVDAVSLVDIGTSGSAPTGSMPAANGHLLPGDGVIAGPAVNDNMFDAIGNGISTCSTAGCPLAERARWLRRAAASRGSRRRIALRDGHAGGAAPRHWPPDQCLRDPAPDRRLARLQRVPYRPAGSFRPQGPPVVRAPGRQAVPVRTRTPTNAVPRAAAPQSRFRVLARLPSCPTTSRVQLSERVSQ